MSSRDLGDIGVFGQETIPDDESPLLPKSKRTRSNRRSYTVSRNDEECSSPVTVDDKKLASGSAGVICLLLIGVFMSSADTTLIISTYATIASQFHQLSNGSWLATSFSLATCAAQPIAGRLSDIYGRKSVLLVSYTLFVLGTLASGAGLTFNQIIVGRLVAGIGGGGSMILVSILITDLVPPIQVAAWRSYVNVAATVGRSLGGPVGGWLADTVGWRWSFIGQIPFLVIAIIFIAFKLKIREEEKAQRRSRRNLGSKLGQIDFIGALLMVGCIITLLLLLDLGGQRIPWSAPIIPGLGVAAIIFGAVFCWYDSRIARVPIFSPELLLQRGVWTSYLISMFQIAAQVGMLFAVPMYFQITENASNSSAGLHLIPAVLGNTIGGLIAGYLISKTGRYKIITILATLSGITCYSILIFRWQGHTSILESLEIFPGGFGAGMVGASTFIALASDLAPENMAMGQSGYYLFVNIGLLGGISMNFAVTQASLRSILKKRLTGEGSGNIIEEVLSDISSIRDAREPIKSILTSSYVKSLENSHIAALCCSIIALILSFGIKEHPLKKK